MPFWRATRFALLTALATELPALADSPSALTPWGLLGAAVGFAMGCVVETHQHATCSSRDWLLCIIAAGLGLAIDCARAPSALWLSLCTSGSPPGFDAATLVTHVQTLPCATGAMLLALVATHWLSRQRTDLRSLAYAVGSTALVFSGMGILMLAAADTMRWVAERAQLPWTIDAMSAAMTLGMFAWFFLERGLHRTLRGQWAA